MACTTDYIDFVCSQLEGVGVIRTKKMFGDWWIYIDEKPIILACDNICYVKMLPEIADLMKDACTGFPYDGAKEMLLVDDIDNREFLCNLFDAMIDELPAPKKK